MPLRFTQRILEHLAHENYKPSPSKATARDMRVDDEDRDAFEQAISNLVQEGKLTIGVDEVIRLPSYSQVKEAITGRFKLNPKGFGFIIPDQPFREGDLFVPPGSAGNAISGDRVRARAVRTGEGRSGFTGRVLDVVERGQEHFVGMLYQEGNRWMVEPDGRSLHEPVLIRDPHAKNAKQGDKVVIELLHYPEGQHVAEGVIVRVLGEAGKPDVETQAVIAAHGLRTEFPEQAVEQARNASRMFEGEANGPWPDREDLTGQFIFTIDPRDAKYFDDAISIAYDQQRNEWTLGVHIADVSHFIPIGSELDEEA